ncbi:MAG: sigma-70 family RNA polymerase sigma factor [Verrucomicrobia bacterium]|nr:sigma-70 family RNA polymerase sigma factor [Verrucomicrobiota bacterium]
MTPRATSRELPHRFPPTRWSVVLEARRETSAQSQAALEMICRSYWYPLYAHVRRCGHSSHDAQDLTQEFFCRLLEKKWLDTADREKGRLRTFLIVALKKFMAKEWRRASAQKRGGGEVPVPMDTAFAESRYVADASANLRPDDVFDQQWALTLIELTLDRLRNEFAAAGKQNDFEALKTCLMAERGAIDYGSVAVGLGINEGAARVSVHRLRKRFREIYREEISQTLSSREELDTELRHLAEALSRG